jgi:hypothetical protein
MTTSKTTPSEPIGALRIKQAFDIVFKHVAVVIVWDIDGDKPAFYYQFTKEEAYYLGRVKTLNYLREAHDNVRRKSGSREGL